MRLAGRRALVTGAGSGIGRAIALAFAREGAKLALAGRREAPLGETAAEIARAGGAALVLPADLSVPEVARHAVERSVAALGGLDVLINNAAAYLPKPLAGTSLEEWDRTFAINLRAPFVLIQAALPHLAAAGKGSVLNVSSNLAGRPVAGAAAYAVSKAGLDHLTQVIALEWGPMGVRANSLRLVIVDTPIHAARALPDRSAWLASAGRLHPVGRAGLPADAAAAAVFLASDEASWITGALFHVDGGIGLV